MAADVLARDDRVARRVEETGRVEPAGQLEGGLAEALGQRREQIPRETVGPGSAGGASTATSSIEPLPQTPQDDDV